MRTAHRVIGLALAIPLLAPLVQAQDGGYKEEIYLDFRNRKAVSPEFTTVGSDFGQRATPEIAGLRIALPAARSANGGVGVESRLAISGDFEITGAFESFSAQEPKRAVAGVNLFIVQGGEGKRSTRLGRFNTVDGDVYSLNHTDPDRGPRPPPPRLPTTDTNGKLRLVRKGHELTYLVASGERFLELFKTDFGNDDLKLLRFVVHTSDGPSAVNVHLVDLRVRFGGEKVGAEARQAQRGDANDPANSPRAADPRERLVAALIVAMALTLLVLIAVGAWLFWRRRRHTEEPAEGNGARSGLQSKGTKT